MITCTLSVATALLACPGFSAPVLLGRATPAGDYIARPAAESRSIHYADGGAGLTLALHPVWTPERAALIGAPSERRRIVTDGCVNLLPDDFAKLPKTKFRFIIK